MLKEWEVALIKAMVERGDFTDLDIQAHFTDPKRTVDLQVIREIRTGAEHASLQAAGQDDLNDFLEVWRDLDPGTGLCPSENELLIKAREAMIAAVHTFNGAGLTFRAELFIVTSMIAWTYLFHAWFKREGIDYRYEQKTKQGADKFWDLAKCLKHAQCPVSEIIKTNLEFLLAIRHEIEHRTTNRIDEAVGREMQSCCINFNDSLKSLFGPQHGLERRFDIALQFVSFGYEQRENLKQAPKLPIHVANLINAFENGLTDEQLADPAFRYRVAFVPFVNNRASGADDVIEFIKPSSEGTGVANRVLLKQANRKRYTATQVVKAANEKGHTWFNLHEHTKLWKKLETRDPGKNFGCQGDYKNTWVWFDNWINLVLEHCSESSNR